MKPVTITRCGPRSNSTYTYESLAAAIEAHRHILEKGRSYESERGNKKINMNPRSAKILVDNLNKAVINAAAHQIITFSINSDLSTKNHP